MIYLDSAATTKPCEQAADAILSAMKNSFGNASSPVSYTHLTLPTTELV